MSKKKATSYEIYYVHHKSRPEYIRIDFIDKKGRVMRSSVDVLLNMEYLDADVLDGYVLSR